MKYWSNNDLVKLADTNGEEAPVEAFKTFSRDKKSTFGKPTTDKVPNITHWSDTNKIGDPEFKFHHEP